MSELVRGGEDPALDRDAIPGVADNRRAAFASYTIDEDLLGTARPGAVVMHCLPAHRGEGIASDVADGPASIIYEQAENRLRLQKALLGFLMGERGAPA